jgi:hypothetical protein
MSEMWRVIDTGLRPAAQNIALNRALLEARQANEIPSTLRFLRFAPSALLGYHQSAEQELNLFKARERALTKTLVKAEAKYASLLEEYQEMQKKIQSGPLQITGSSALELLEDERDRAHEEIVRLEGELAKEKEKRIAVEKRRDALQAKLDKTDAELVKAGGSAFAVGTYDSDRQLLVVMRGRATRWGGAASLVAVPLVIFGTPLYLGLVYHTLTPSQEPLKVITICVLLIPMWFALAMRKVERPEDGRKLRQTAWLIVLTTVLFFIAALI